MDRKEVDSSQINSVGYDKDSQILEVEFLSGGLYQYIGVSKELAHELVTAESVGRHFNQNVKNKFQTFRIEDGERVEVPLK